MIVSINFVMTQNYSLGVAFFSVKFQLPYVRPFLEFVQVFLESYGISWVGNGSVKESRPQKKTELRSYSCWSVPDEG